MSIFLNTDKLKIINEDILKTRKIKDGTVDLIITSPPYNLDIKYNSHKDKIAYPDYLDFSRKWIKKCFKLLKNDGRFCLNIPLDKNKDGQQSVGADLTCISKEVGFKYHSTIIWNEGNISRRTAWGSFKSASAPYVIAPVELIIILYNPYIKDTRLRKLANYKDLYKFYASTFKRLKSRATKNNVVPVFAIVIRKYVWFISIRSDELLAKGQL